ncbi:MAG: NAD-dependent protein deacylase [Oscillospiraceae bacterium]|nr:NAD-dependent protein deacylase [Oscillospiraceae bacterium]
MQEKISRLQSIIDNSRRVVFFGGRGVSTESGISDFRSADGLYNQKYKFPPEIILSHGFFMNSTKHFYDYYRDKMLALDARPNRAHKWLAQLELRGRLKAVVTQNIDGLHQAAGSKRVFELHGTVHKNYCMQCGKFYPVSFIRESEGIPRCECGGTVKPDVVLYDEDLDMGTVDRSVRAIQEADTMIVAGTSLTVYPAAGLVRYFNGDNLILINRDTTGLDSAADLVIRGNVGEILSQIKIR